MVRRCSRIGALALLVPWGVAGCQSLDIQILADAAVSGDASHDTGRTDSAIPDASKDGGTARHDASDGSVSRDAAHDTGQSCVGDGACHDAGLVMACPPGNQMTFPVTVQGDANAEFTSAVVTRSRDRVYVFDGLAAGDGGTSTQIYAQAFSASTGASLAPAALLYASPNGSGLFLHDAATAPGGQIVVLYGYGGFPQYGYYAPNALQSQESPLNALFLEGGGPGSLGLTVLRNVTVESGRAYGQAHAVWDDVAGAFVLSWEYFTNDVVSGQDEYGLRFSTYSPNGVTSSGSLVTTDQEQNFVAFGAVEQGSIGVSGNALGVSYVSLQHGYPEVSLVASQGTLVSPPLAVSISMSSLYSGWIVTAGTPKGIVALYNGSSGGPISGGFVTPSFEDGGTPSMSTFTVAGSAPAIGARAVGDGADGGVGAGLLYEDGLYFDYVSPEGTPAGAPTNQLSHVHVAANGDAFNISSYGGGFVIGLYDGSRHMLTAAVSGCAPP